MQCPVWLAKSLPVAAIAVSALPVVLSFILSVSAAAAAVEEAAISSMAAASSRSSRPHTWGEEGAPMCGLEANCVQGIRQGLQGCGSVRGMHRCMDAWTSCLVMATSLEAVQALQEECMRDSSAVLPQEHMHAYPCAKCQDALLHSTGCILNVHSTFT